MGTKRERQPGVWQLRVSAGTDAVDGSRRVVTETFRGSERAASKRLAELETDVGRGGGSTSLPLRKVIQLWRAAADHAPGTVRNYDLAQSTITRRVLDTPIDRLRAATIRELVDRVEAEHGPHRARLVHAVISGALTWAWRQEWLTSNPARKVAIPAQPKRARTDPTTLEVRRLLLVADRDPMLAAWVRVHATIGGRRGEVLALRWSAITIDSRRDELGVEHLSGQIRIDWALDPITGELKEPKADGRRSVAIGASACAALLLWRAAFLERAKAVKAKPVEDPFVFPGPSSFDGGQPMRPDRGTKLWSRVRASAALVDDDGEPFEESQSIQARLHDVRHYVATELLAAGLPAKLVADMLGHTRVATTTDLYGHAMPASNQAAAAVLEGRLA